jgi:hypothetical protein
MLFALSLAVKKILAFYGTRSTTRHIQKSPPLVLTLLYIHQFDIMLFFSIFLLISSIHLFKYSDFFWYSQEIVLRICFISHPYYVHGTSQSRAIPLLFLRTLVACKKCETYLNNLNVKILLLLLFYGSAAQRGLWLPRSRGFVITLNDAPHSVGILWTNDQLVAETSTWQHHNRQTSTPPPPWDSNLRSQQESDRRPTPQTARPLGPAKVL